MANEVIIVGGGLSGISSAVWAIEKGLRPTIFERSSQLGGRVASLYAKDSNNKIDIGQHVLSTNYKETKNLLAKIGSVDKVDFRKRLKLKFKLNSNSEIKFNSWFLPAPLHFFLPLILNSLIPWNERKLMLKWIFSFNKLTPDKLKKLTAKEWLRELGDSPFFDKLIWEPLTIATLNTPFSKASAYSLYQVLTKAFFKSSFSSGLGFPMDYLDEIFGNPANKYIKSKGGSIYLRSEVKKLIPTGDKIQAIQTNQDQIIETPYLILATSPNELLRLTSGLPEPYNKPFSNLDKFEYSPIITINLWFKSQIEVDTPIAFVDSPIQWMFTFPNNQTKFFGYTVVISAAFYQIEYDRQQLIKLVEKEFERFFNKNIHSDFGFINYKIVKEKRATILQTPQVTELKPSSITEYKNLVLAGDWIDPDLPATIESAVISGKQAIQNLIEN